VNGAAHRGRGDGTLEEVFCVTAQVGEDAGDQVFEELAAPEDLCAGEAAAGEIRLERLNEAALGIGGKVAFNALGSTPGVELRACLCFRLLEVEERAVGGGESAESGEVRELDAAVLVCACDGAVGGAEVDAEHDTCPVCVFRFQCFTPCCAEGRPHSIGAAM
jgi:hypothetical protein